MAGDERTQAPAGTGVPAEGRASLIDRFMGLSDAVFGIALTLLALNIAVPQVASGNRAALESELADLWPDVSVWLLSFAVIAVMWRVQHVSLDSLRSLDRVIVLCNFALLALVSLLPFSSDLMGTYGDVPIAVSIYAANVGLASGSLALAGWWAARHGHRARRYALGLYGAPAVVFLLSIPIAYLSTTAAQLFWLTLIPIGIIRRRREAGGA